MPHILDFSFYFITYQHFTIKKAKALRQNKHLNAFSAILQQKLK